MLRINNNKNVAKHFLAYKICGATALTCAALLQYQLKWLRLHFMFYSILQSSWWIIITGDI